MDLGPVAVGVGPERECDLPAIGRDRGVARSRRRRARSTAATGWPGRTPRGASSLRDRRPPTSDVSSSQTGEPARTTRRGGVLPSTGTVHTYPPSPNATVEPSGRQDRQRCPPSTAPFPAGRETRTGWVSRAGRCQTSELSRSRRKTMPPAGVTARSRGRSTDAIASSRQCRGGCRCGRPGFGSPRARPSRRRDRPVAPLSLHLSCWGGPVFEAPEHREHQWPEVVEVVAALLDEDRRHADASRGLGRRGRSRAPSPAAGSRGRQRPRRRRATRPSASGPKRRASSARSCTTVTHSSSPVPGRDRQRCGCSRGRRRRRAPR